MATLLRCRSLLLYYRAALSHCPNTLAMATLHSRSSTPLLPCSIDSLVFCFWKYIFSINLSALRGREGASNQEVNCDCTCCQAYFGSFVVVFVAAWQLVKRNNNRQHVAAIFVCRLLYKQTHCVVALSLEWIIVKFD